MHKLFLAVSALSLFCLASGGAQALGGDAEKVVQKTLADNSDMKALCSGGQTTVRDAVRKAVTSLMQAGDISGDPQAIGGEAGAHIGAMCVKMKSGG